MVEALGKAATTLGKALPGLGLAASLAAAATLVSTLHGGPQLLYALFFGVALNYLSNRALFKPGIEFGARAVLRLGVGLLGARITAEQVLALGWHTAAVVVVAVATTIGFAVLLSQRLGLGRVKGVLAGGSVAICGASAALAIAAVLPKQKDSERFTLMVVVSVTVLSTVAMVLYPLLVRAFHMPPELGGLFLGGTIHDVAQVVGAGYTINPATGDVATIVKLFRVALLVVVVATVALVFREENAAGAGDAAGGSALSVWRQRLGLIPWFLWLFVAMVVLNSTLGLQGLAPVLGSASRACLVLAIAALGLKTSFMQLARMGWRPAALILAATVWLAMLVLMAIWWW
jgi:uncharacterized integral membrane protein (TIGR00698 family)